MGLIWYQTKDLERLELRGYILIPTEVCARRYECSAPFGERGTVVQNYGAEPYNCISGGFNPFRMTQNHGSALFGER